MTEPGLGHVCVDKREAYNDTTVSRDQSTGPPLEDAIYTPLLPELRTVPVLFAHHCAPRAWSFQVPQPAALALLRPGNAGLVPRAEGA